MSRSKFSILLKKDLQGLARGFGLNDDGRKADLEERLVDYFQTHKEELVHNYSYSKFFNLSDLEDSSSSTRNSSVSRSSSASVSVSDDHEEGEEEEEEEKNEEKDENNSTQEAATNEKKLTVLDITADGNGEKFQVALRGVDVFYNSFKLISSDVSNTVLSENIKLQKKLSSVPVITTLFVGFETGLILFHHLYNYYTYYQNAAELGSESTIAAAAEALPSWDLLSLLKLTSFYGSVLVLLPVIASFYFNLTASRLILDPLIFALAKLMLTYFLFVGSSASAPLTEMLGTAGYADRLYAAVGNVPFFTAFTGILIAMYDTIA